MIQFNLLPDVKLEYVRVQRTKHAVISAAMIAAGSAFVIFLLLFLAVNVVQKKSIGDLNSDIKKYSTELKNTPDLDKILTIQSQLQALPALHAAKPAANRSFTYIQQLTPPKVSLTDVTTDYATHTIEITGQSNSLDSVNALVDTLKYTKYATEDVKGQKAFSGVVLKQFTKNLAATTFSVTASYEPAIFDNSKRVSLTIPNGVTTPSVVGQPQEIFKKATPPPTNGNAQ